jgi:hypothetical protein
MRLSSFFVAAVLATSSLASLAGCVAAPAEDHAMRNGYSYLGERWVAGHGREVHEAITGLRGDGRWTSVMFVVENAPVEMDEIVVTFGDGEKFAPPTRLVFGPDSTTRMIDLPGGARVIRRVDFFMHNLPGDGKAKVELWAR